MAPSACEPPPQLNGCDAERRRRRRGNPWVQGQRRDALINLAEALPCDAALAETGGVPAAGRHHRRASQPDLPTLTSPV